jgi:hypothetical protein
MPIISVRKIKHPCYPSERLSYFYEGGETGRIWKQAIYSPFSLYKLLTNFSLQLLEVVLVQRENY